MGQQVLRVVRTAVCVVAVLGAAASQAAADATITIINGNAPAIGFNDPTPAAPVGGNLGTTVGEQRLIAFQHAADLWDATLDSPVEIRVYATFEPLTCTPTAAVLGSAGPRFALSAFASVGAFPGAVLPNLWHPAALADKRAGTELNSEPDPEWGVAPQPDIRARFNGNIGQPNCLADNGWYYGLDANQPANRINLVTVLLHEFAHGLGFTQFANLSTGKQVDGMGDVYGARLLDTSTFKYWNEMTDAERAASAVNMRRVVWDGPAVHAATPRVLSVGTPNVIVHTPDAAAGVYEAGPANFGALLTVEGLNGEVVQALDAAISGTSPTTTDACSPITNGAAVAGKIALVDRGTCAFPVKVKNAQNAGAIAVIVVDNAPGGPAAGIGGVDPTILIPSVRVTLADGARLKAALGTAVTVTLALNPTLLAGADAQGRVFINATKPVQPGSSISHWDTLTTPNQLMEPAVNADLTHSLQPPQDLTLAMMRDIGWFSDADNDGYATDQDRCDTSDLSATVVINGEDTQVGNVLFASGCTMADEIAAAAASAANHGAFVSAVADLANAWHDGELISGAQKGAIQSAAGHSLPGK